MGGTRVFRRVGVVLFLSIGLPGACSEPDPGVPAPQQQSTAVQRGTARTDPLIPPTSLSSAVSAEASAAVETLVREGGPFAGLTDDERTCLAVRLDADPVLLAELGLDPRESSRFPDLNDLSRDCTNDTVLASRFAVSTAERYRDVVPEELRCLRDEFAGLTQEQLDALYASGVVPGSLPPDSVPDVAATCGLAPERKVS